MGFWGRFIIRALLSIFFSFALSYFFFKDLSVVRVGGLAAVLMGFAYLFEYTKKRDKGGGYGS
jgi:hypothetical protein